MHHILLHVNQGFYKAFISGIASASYHNVNYFEGVNHSEIYDDVYNKGLQVKDIAVLSYVVC